LLQHRSTFAEYNRFKFCAPNRFPLEVGVFKFGIKRSSLLVAVVTISLVSFAGAAGPADEHGHWSYSGDSGPDHWGQLNPEYEECSKGHQQSPVNIVHAKHANLPPIEFNYQPAALAVVNNGHTIQVNYAPGSSINVGDKTYELVQFHFHHVSENTFNGKHSPLEGHLVHKSSDGHLAVVAVLFDEGAANPAITAVWSNLSKEEGQENKPAGVKVRASQLLPEKHEYYTFPGSLTTPPCSEGVTWLVLSHKMTASKEQIAAFAALYPNDARPLEPLNGRKILEGGK
jgi:carbonic anhydrase